ncbi:MAG: DNA alkylation repair protein [Acutalibacteraceae bacterium]|nr:DNA alkylation repair protein [Acutalibacteraceae bacterium]
MIQTDLFGMADENYKNFHKKLIPTVDENLIIGIRTPKIRKYAKQIFNTDEAQDFLKTLPHKYYEENNLHAFLIEQIKDFDQCANEVTRFLPYIDNWATCDMLRPKVFKKNPEKTFEFIQKWIKSDSVYAVRYAIVTLLSNFLDDEFSPKHLQLVKSAICDEYYINMAVAWYYSIALVKQYDNTVPLFENKALGNDRVHNKALQKARESTRISEKTKEYLNSLKVGR